MNIGAVSHTLKESLAKIKLVAFDFDGVFTDNHVYVFQDGREAVRCSRSDGIGINELKQCGIQTLIISTEVNDVVSARARKLSIECYSGCKNKLAVLNSIITVRGISLDQVAFVGNDINDLECLQSVGAPIVVHDAHPDVLGYSIYVTLRPGGGGAVREVCDLMTHVMSEYRMKERA